MATILKDLLPQLIEAQDWKIKLLENWQEIVGSLNTRIKLEQIKETTLIIGVYELCWMQELYMLSKVILNSINRALDGNYVTSLKFKIAKEQEIIISKNIKQYKVRNIKQLILTQEDKNALTKIKDEQLQNALIGFFTHCYQ